MEVIDFENPKLPTREELNIYKEVNGLVLQDILAMASNNDPFWFGTETDIKQAKWGRDVWEKVNPEHSRIHLRKCHYKYLSLPVEERKSVDGTIYENSKSHWKLLQGCNKKAREFDLIDPAEVIDKYSPTSTDYCPTIEMKIDKEDFRWELSYFDWSIPDAISWNPEIRTPLAPDLDDFPEVMFEENCRYGYSAFDQPYRLIVFIEKSTMNAELLPVCRKYGAHFIPGKGFNSHTRLFQLLRDIVDKYGNKPTLIFYISDYDLRGQDMPKQAARLLQYYGAKHFPDADIKLKPIALFEAQTWYIDADGSEKQLPKAPDKEQIELDALEVYFPGKLAEILENQLLKYYDQDLMTSKRAAQEEAEKEVNFAWKQATENQRGDLKLLEGHIAEITDRYEARVSELNDEGREALQPIRQKLDVLNTEMAEELGPYQDRLDELENEINNAMPEIDWPEVPESDLNPSDDKEWLFDSGRTYLEQKPFYNEYIENSIRGEGSR